MDKLVADYAGKLRVVIKQNPLPFHNNAMVSSQAAMAANDQGKFKQMHDLLLQNYRTLDRPTIDRLAQQVGLDMARFKTAVDTNANKNAIETDMKLAASLGASGTPASFVNGRFLGGAQPYEKFKAIVDEELKK